MAEFLGLPLRTYQKIEAGNVPQKATMRRITSKLGVTEAALVQLPAGTPEASGPVSPDDAKSLVLGQIVGKLAGLNEKELRAYLGLIDRARDIASVQDLAKGQHDGDLRRKT